MTINERLMKSIDDGHGHRYIQIRIYRGIRWASMTGDKHPVRLPQTLDRLCNACCPCSRHQHVFHHLPCWEIYINVLPPAPITAETKYYCLHFPECGMETESVAINTKIVVDNDDQIDRYLIVLSSTRFVARPLPHIIAWAAVQCGPAPKASSPTKKIDI